MIDIKAILDAEPPLNRLRLNPIQPAICVVFADPGWEVPNHRTGRSTERPTVRVLLGRMAQRLAGQR